MKLSEFKAWLEGFSESFSNAPNPEQWERIKDKIEQLKPEIVKEIVYQGFPSMPVIRDMPLRFEAPPQLDDKVKINPFNPISITC